MENAENLHIEVAYARPDGQWVLAVEVPAGTRVEDAIRLSGMLEQCPEIDLAHNKVGIFGRLCPLDQHLQRGDRVEIYRALIADPKQARKKRAARERS